MIAAELSLRRGALPGVEFRKVLRDAGSDSARTPSSMFHSDDDAVASCRNFGRRWPPSPIGREERERFVDNFDGNAGNARECAATSGAAKTTRRSG